MAIGPPSAIATERAASSEVVTIAAVRRAERQTWPARNCDYVGRSRPSDCGRGEPRREPHRQE